MGKHNKETKAAELPYKYNRAKTIRGEYKVKESNCSESDLIKIENEYVNNRQYITLDPDDDC